MTAIDSRIVLALTAKAERVFGGPGKMLSFPLSGASYSAQQLNFIPAESTAEAARAAVGALANFSAFVNLVPGGQIFETVDTGRSTLPAVYRAVLEHAEIADLPESEDDRAKRNAARAVLVKRGANGAERNSEKFSAYKRCQDAYLLADQQYNAARISGELAATPEEVAEWELNKPLLAAAREQALNDWNVLGFRAEIEDALATVAALTPKTPNTAWDEWKLRSSVGVGTETDLTGANFWPVYLSPGDAASFGWQKMTLNSGEVTQLQESAPAELRARLASGDSQLPVESLEFEFSTAQLVRPWFDSNAFVARFWKPLNGAPALISSGAQPFEGHCPLYANGVVLFRNIRATVKGDSGAVQNQLEQANQGYDAGMFRFKRDRMQVMRTAATAGNPTLRYAHALRANNVAAVRAAPSATGRVSSFGKRVIMRERPTELIYIPLQPAPAPAPSPAPPPEKVVVATGADEIFILALVCKVLPRSPDPDPALHWIGGG